MNTVRAVRFVIAAVAVVGGGTEIGLALTSGATASRAPHRHAAGPTARDHSRPAPTRPTTTTTTTTNAASTTTLPPTTTSTLATAAPAPSGHRSGRGAAAPPRLAALEPAAGRPGATITLVGSGFLSQSGLILADFGAEPAPTRCPSQNRCLVTVPPGRPGTEVVVRVRTSAGSSGGLPFSYR